MNSDKKVIVLLSSYNGEKYIREQIDSILSQTYKNIELFVRDDGSKDDTPSILSEYAEKGLIRYERGENVGFIKSFFSLIKEAGPADYYAFSDQDDVWLPEKIAMAVEKLEKYESKGYKQKPLLYFSNYDFYDADMNFIKPRDLKNPNISFANSLVDCVPLGFNSVFNAAARNSVVCHEPSVCVGHDSWMYILCAAKGGVIFDRRSTAKYRRHSNNVSDGGANFIKFQIWRFKKFFLNNYFTTIRAQIKEFDKLYGDTLSDANKKTLKLFTLDGFHPVNSLKKVFYPKKLRQSLLDEIFLRLIFLMGRL